MSLLSMRTTKVEPSLWPPGALAASRRSAEAEVWEAIGSASAAIGEETFYDRLLEVPAALVEADLLSLMRYSSFGAPDLVIPREIRAEVAAPYISGLYAFDPFHHYWRTVAQPTVTSLRRLAPAEMWKSRYALEFMRAASISDEIAVFLPPLGGASPTLILDRAKGGFTASELARVERVFPLLAGLHNAHLKSIVSRGMIGHAQEKPLRLIDRSGKELAVNLAWRMLAGDPKSRLVDAMAELAASGASEIALADGRLLISSSLAADFGAAPGGRCYQVEVPALSAPRAPCDSWLAPLTPRERQIVMLTLRGPSHRRHCQAPRRRARHHQEPSAARLSEARHHDRTGALPDPYAASPGGKMTLPVTPPPTKPRFR